MTTATETKQRSKRGLDITRLPKAELHVHIEGSVRPGTLRDLAAITEPGDQLARWLADPDGAAVTSMSELLAMLAQINELLADPKDFGRIASETLRDLSAQGVIYAELRFNPFRPMHRGLPLDEIVGAIREAQAAARAAYDLHSELILGLNRNRGPDEAAAIVARARDLPAEWIAGFDLSDLETDHPPRVFADIFKEIRDAGWPVTIHAGELAGAESVLEAIELLGARRIGHALRAIEDADVMARIARDDIHLELCPGSNRRLGLIDRLTDHPIGEYRARGISYSLNSDDPAVFALTLTDELARDAAAFDLGLADFERMTLEAIRHAFSPDWERERLAQRARAAFAAVTDDDDARLPHTHAATALLDIRSRSAETRLDSLLRVTQAVASEIELDRVLWVAAEQTSRALNAERTTVFVADQADGELWSKVAEGLSIREICLPIGRGLTGVVAETGIPLNVPDAHADPRFDPAWDARTGYHTRSVLTYPLKDREGEVIGVVQSINKRGGVFDEHDEDMLSGIAAAAAAALLNAQHFADMRRLTESALETTAAMLDARDPHTAGHTRRVAQMAELLGRKLGFTLQQLAALRVAAAVHDYGKLSVPDAVLNKPGQLTHAEKDLIHDHVSVTRQILANFEFPAPLADVPRIACEHHERFDGSGYPNGLRTDQISIEGRVLAVADVIDAMTSERPYRPAMAIDETLAYVLEARGTQFDPVVVDAVMESAEDLFRIREDARSASVE